MTNRMDLYVLIGGGGRSCTNPASIMATHDATFIIYLHIKILLQRIAQHPPQIRMSYIDERFSALPS
jgi:hypothetical protein